MPARRLNEVRRRDIHRRELSHWLIAAASGAVVSSSRAGADETGPYPRTAAELSASVTPVNTSFPPGNVRRYGAKGDARTDDRPAIQAAIDSGAGVIFFPSGTYKIGAPLRIRPDSTQNLTLVGESRTNTYLAPMREDIKDSLGVNALIVNQADNGKLSISNLRFWADVAYTGISLYAVEGGCRDHSGQAVFSGSIDNCWFDHNSTSAGVFRGALNNYRVSNCTFEFMKGCFYREGRGMGDVLFSNNVLSNCYDAFYDGLSDAVGDNMVTIDGLHVYTHNRGQIVQTRNSNNWVVSNVIVQAASAPLAGVGLFAFIDSSNILCTAFNTAKVKVFGGSGPLGEAISIDSSTVKLAHGIIDGANFGIRIRGHGRSVVTIADVDIVNSSSAALTARAGAAGSRVSISNCNWSESKGHLIDFTPRTAFDLSMSQCRLMNAGMGASTARNIHIVTKGRACFDDCVIGKDNPAATAAFYLDCGGAGELLLRRPTFLGTAPTGIKTGDQPVSVINEPPATLL